MKSTFIDVKLNHFEKLRKTFESKTFLKLAARFESLEIYFGPKLTLKAIVPFRI